MIGVGAAMANHVLQLTNHAARSAGEQYERSKSESPLVWKLNLRILFDVIAFIFFVGEITNLKDPGDIGDLAGLLGVAMLVALAGCVLSAGVLAGVHACATACPNVLPVVQSIFS